MRIEPALFEVPLNERPSDACHDVEDREVITSPRRYGVQQN
jgi:hypothetical protein